MILIEKGREPHSWTEHRLTEGAKYEATPALRDALLAEQGYICAYCMRRIPVQDKGTDETSRIEHIIPQSELSREEAMNYGNMVICCPGAVNSTAYRDSHCDRHKGENPISFTPFDRHTIETLSYKSDDTIESTDKDYNRDINEVLNLNNPLLKRNRKAVRDQIIKSLGKKEWKRADIESMLNTYLSKDANGCRKEYCGVAIHYLTRKLRGGKWLSKN